jgi:hypothetical protein
MLPNLSALSLNATAPIDAPKRGHEDDAFEEFVPKQRREDDESGGGDVSDVNPFVDTSKIVLARHTDALWTIDPYAPEYVLAYETTRRGYPKDLLYRQMHFYIDHSLIDEFAYSRYGDYVIYAPYVALKMHGTFALGDEWRWVDSTLFACVYTDMYIRQHKLEEEDWRAEWRKHAPGVYDWPVTQADHEVILSVCATIPDDDWPFEWDRHEDRDILFADRVDIGGGSTPRLLPDSGATATHDFDKVCETLRSNSPWWLPAIIKVEPLTSEIVWNATGSTNKERQASLLKCIIQASGLLDAMPTYTIKDGITPGTVEALDNYTEWWSADESLRMKSQNQYEAARNHQYDAPLWTSWT